MLSRTAKTPDIDGRRGSLVTYGDPSILDDMASRALETFEANRADVDRLMEVHGDISGGAPGRKYRVEVLNKSAIVLLCASWEAFCEDLVSEVVEHFVKHAPNANALPKLVRKRIARDFRGDEMRMWTLADGGWRQVLTAQLTDLKEERDRMLNTPKTAQIRSLFADHVGYADVTADWHWQKRTVQSSIATLDTFVTLRGAIAHRASAPRSVHKTDVMKNTQFISGVVHATDRAISDHVLAVTQAPLT